MNKNVTQLLRNYYVVLIAFAVVAILWFSLGVLVPKIFDSLALGGQFGDGFGSVNALFSGLGFVALSYTMYLQIRANEQRHKDMEELRSYDLFKFYYEYLNEIKGEIDQITIDGAKGYDAILLLVSHAEKNLDDDLYSPKIFSLAYLVDQLGDYANLLKESQHKINQERFETLCKRLNSCFERYFVELTYMEITPSRENSTILLLQESAKALSDIIIALQKEYFAKQLMQNKKSMG